MAFTPKLTYKGKPLVRKDNELYYGRMTDPYVLYLQILSTKQSGNMQVADKVHLQLLSTDEAKTPLTGDAAKEYAEICAELGV